MARRPLGERLISHLKETVHGLMAAYVVQNSELQGRAKRAEEHAEEAERAARALREAGAGILSRAEAAEARAAALASQLELAEQTIAALRTDLAAARTRVPRIPRVRAGGAR